MAKTEVKAIIVAPVMKRLEQVYSHKNSRLVGDQIVEAARELIASGQSPVKGVGRFEEYSGAKKSLRGKKSVKNTGYPYNVQKQYPSKKLRPVNLELSGEMLDALEVKPDRRGPKIGIFNAEMRDRALKHNNGDPKKGIPERHFWPTRRGEQFTVTITRMIKDTYAEIISKLLR